MQKLVFALMVVCVTGALSAQQPAPTGPAGTWEIDETNWAIVLELNGSTLSGKVMQGAQEFEIYDGKVDGSTVTFKAKSPDGDRTITFVGKVDGDVIAFTRQVEIREGGAPGGNALMGGPNGPAEFVARRATGVAWTGTIRNAPTPRNPNPNPNIRQVTVGTRKMPDPHWRWRGGEKELTFRTFNLPNQSFQLNGFELAGDRLTYSYTQPGPGDEVTCALTRQPQGQFAGVCRREAGTILFLVELTPPATPGR
jgi:hypothetical protein